MRHTETATEQCLKTVVVNLRLLKVNMVPHCRSRIRSQTINDVERESRMAKEHLEGRTEDGAFWTSGFLFFLFLVCNFSLSWEDQQHCEVYR